MNPIIAREVRSRWRGIKAFGLVLGYAAPLAIAIVLAYDSALGNQPNVGSFRARHMGQDVFTTLAIMQVLGWMLFAPTLTATTIAGERERGLLESLQLSPLTAWQIVSGKFTSALVFMLLTMVAALPVQAICLMMGGVSPGEFVTVFALSLSTALVCSALGIVCSAWTRRGGIAFRSTFILVVAWGIGSAVCWGWSAIGSGFFGTLFRTVTSLVAMTNPIIAAVSILEPRLWGSSPIPGAIGSASPFFQFAYSVPLWGWCMLFQILATLLMLWSAARAVRRPLPEQYWIETTTGDGGSAHSAGRKARRPRSWWEVPLLSQLTFANPVLTREARGKFRLRQVPSWVLALEVMLALGVGVFYCYLVYWALYIPDARQEIWWGIVGFGFFILLLSVSIMGAGAFTRERESGTWEGLMLSTLPAPDILIGKAVAILLTCLLISLPVWPLLLLCIRPGDGSQYFNGGILPLQAVLTAAIITATAAFYLALSMLVSWCCRRTPVAVGWMLALLFGLNILLPVIMGMTGLGELTIRAYPWFALGAVGELSSGTYGHPYISIISSLVVHGILAALLFGILADFLTRERS